MISLVLVRTKARFCSSPKPSLAMLNSRANLIRVARAQQCAFVYRYYYAVNVSIVFSFHSHNPRTIYIIHVNAA